MNKPISEEIFEICEKICDEICRYPLIYTRENFGDAEYMSELLENHCKKCPLRRLI